MLLEAPGSPLVLRELPRPAPGRGEVLVRVHACAVCRTDLHIVDGELPEPALPLIPGHEIVGTVEEVGEKVEELRVGDRVGIPWLGWSCGRCRDCTEGRENLCPEARFTGYTRPGGYAEYTVADARYAFRLPGSLTEAEEAPLLCAGLIGYRAYTLAGKGRRLGLYGFGAAAHLLIQLALHDGWEVYAFTRPGDLEGQDFARELGATWAGDSDVLPPEPLDAAILFAPVGALVPAALRAIRPAGTVVCAGIHMSDIPGFPYALLWEERVLRSVANLTRRDAAEYLDLAPRIPIRSHSEILPLARANEALDRLRAGEVRGAFILVP